jgi:hypothetical protein
MSTGPHYSSKLTMSMLDELVKDLSKSPPPGPIIMMGGRGFGKSMAAAAMSHGVETYGWPHNMGPFKEAEISDHPFLQALLVLVSDFSDDILEVTYMCKASSAPRDVKVEVKNRITEKLCAVLYDHSEDEVKDFMEMVDLIDLTYEQMEAFELSASPYVVRSKESIYFLRAQIKEAEAKKLYLAGRKIELEKQERDRFSKQQTKNMMRYAHRRK